MVPKYKQQKYCRFIKTDISEYYPSILEEVLEKAISFVKSIANINGNAIQVIKHGRKSLLFDNARVWVKNDDNPLFDVTMRSFDGAEVCELFSLCLTKNLKIMKDDLELLFSKRPELVSKCRHKN